MKPNYQAWHIEIDAFPESGTISDQLTFLLNFAILAPSSHNCQPWQFSIEDNSILIQSNPAYHLPISDPDQRHEFLSFGCAIENLLVAADYYGFSANISYLVDSHTVAKVALEKINKSIPPREEKHLIFAIPDRRTNRAPYESTEISADFVQQTEELSDGEVTLHVISDTTVKNTIAELLLKERIAIFANRAFRKELADYKRTNLTRSTRGIPGFAMGFSTPFSLIAPYIIRYINIGDIVVKKEEPLLKEHTPAFVLLSTKENNPLSWLTCGQRLERMMLLAVHNGMQTAINAHPQDIQSIQKILKTDFIPQILVRVGYTNKKSHHTPRVLLENLLEKNQK